MINNCVLPSRGPPPVRIKFSCDRSHTNSLSHGSTWRWVIQHTWCSSSVGSESGSLSLWHLPPWPPCPRSLRSLRWCWGPAVWSVTRIPARAGSLFLSKTLLRSDIHHPGLPAPTKEAGQGAHFPGSHCPVQPWVLS